MEASCSLPEDEEGMETIHPEIPEPVQDIKMEPDDQLSPAEVKARRKIIKFLDDTLDMRNYERLSAAIKHYMRNWIPVVYQDLGNVSQEKVQKMLFDPIRVFLLGGDDATKHLLYKELMETYVCFHEFGYQEKMYFCLACDGEQLSTFCLDCFMNSEHRDHDYRIMFSEGGETCMCGDDELSRLRVQTCKSCKLHVRPIRDLASLHKKSTEGTETSVTDCPEKPAEKTEEDELVQAADSSMQLSNCLEGQSDEPNSSEEKKETEPMQDEETPSVQEAMQVNYDEPDCPDANSEEEVSVLGSETSVCGSTPEKGEASNKPENENTDEYELIHFSEQNPLRRIREGIFRLMSYIVNITTQLDCGKAKDPKLVTEPTSGITSSYVEKSKDLYCIMLQRNSTIVDKYDEDKLVPIICENIAAYKENYAAADHFLRKLDVNGRLMLQTGTYKDCLATYIALYTKLQLTGFYVVLLQYSTAAHQLFAVDLMKWLQQVVQYDTTLKTFFSSAMLQKLEKKPQHMLLEKIMLSSRKIWVDARYRMCNLLFRCMYFGKHINVQYGKIFLKTAPEILKKVPCWQEGPSIFFERLLSRVLKSSPVSKKLVTEHDALFTLFKLFHDQSVTICVNGKITMSFKDKNFARLGKKVESYYFLLEIIGTLMEEDGTDEIPEMKSDFMKAFSIFVSVLGMMQNMNVACQKSSAVVKWSGFLSSFFLSYYEKVKAVIPSMIMWCSVDPTLLIEGVKRVMTEIDQNPPCGLLNGQVPVTVAGHTASCLNINPSCPGLSCHLPLGSLYFRLMQSGLCEDPSFIVPMQPAQLLALMYQAVEPLLYVIRLDKQTNSTKFNENKKYRTRCEMVDEAVLVLQMSACNIENNQFLIHLLHRFNLAEWMNNPAKPLHSTLCQGFSPHLRDLLTILLAVVGERFTPGLGADVEVKGCVRHEVVQLLCVRPMSHTELTSHLFNDSLLLNKVLTQVANVREKKEGQIYELKPEYSQQFNPLYYHFDEKLRAQAKENQLMRLKRSKQTANSIPPPKPPRFSSDSTQLAGLLDCDVMLLFLKNILSRTVDANETVITESDVEVTLHLIGYSLMEEEGKASEDTTRRFSSAAESVGLLPGLLEALVTCPRAQHLTDLVSWVTEKYNHIVELKKKSTESDQPSVKRAKKTENPTKSNNSQKSQFLKEMQASLIKSCMNTSRFEMDKTEEGAVPTENDEAMTEAVEKQSPIAVGPQRSPASPYDASYTCVICLAPEVRNCNPDSKNVVMPALVQGSTVLCRDRKLLTKPSNKTELPHQVPNSILLCANLAPAPYTNSCGHKMHTECYKSLNIVRNIPSSSPLPFLLESEFRCPLCHSLSNAVLPVFPGTESMVQHLDAESSNTVTLDSWYQLLKIASMGMTSPSLNPMDLNTLDSTLPSLTWLPTVQSELLNSLTPDFKKQISKIFPEENDNNSKCTDSFCSLSYQISNDNEDFCNNIVLASCATKLQSKDLQLILTIASGWKTCAYTIHGVERMQRESSKALLGDFSERQAETLRSLILAPMFVYIHDKVMSCVAQTLVRTLTQHNNEHGTCILDWDAFGMLVTLTSTSSYLLNNDLSSIPACGTKEQLMLHIVLLAYLVSLMLGTTWGEVEDEGPSGAETEGREALQLLRLVYKSAGLPPPPTWLSPNYIWHKLTTDCIPFLRCCTIYFHFLSGVEAPEALTQPGGDTFLELTRYLGLPSSCHELLGPRCASVLATGWASHPRVRLMVQNDTIIRGPLMVNQLIPLPEEFCQLFNSEETSARYIDNKRTVLCLVCGEWVQFMSQYDKVVLKDRHLGLTLLHSYHCGVNTGLFINVLECLLFAMKVHNKGCFLPVPYVDEHGQTDPGLVRGKAMRFSPKLYSKLNQLWLSHNLLQQVALKYSPIHGANLESNGEQAAAFVPIWQSL